MLVESAIAAAYGSAEYTVQDGQTRRQLRRQELPVLLKRKAELELSISRLTGGGPSYAMPVDSPRCLY